MFKIAIDKETLFDDSKNEFIHVDGKEIELEHSLVAISEWEKKYHKPFMATTEKTSAELVYYIRCMALNENNKELLDEKYAVIIAKTPSYIGLLKAYLDNPMTATTVKSSPGKHSNEVVTSEVMYYWIVAHQIDFQVQYWPLPRLIKLVEVCNAKNQPNKKMGKTGTMDYHRAMNAARRPKKS